MSVSLCIFIFSLPFAFVFSFFQPQWYPWYHNITLGLLTWFCRFYKHINVFRELYRVVGFEVETQSIHRDKSTMGNDDGVNNCDLPSGSDVEPQPVIAKGNGPQEVYFTYSVTWKPSDISWASRWDIYLAMTDVEIHWFSIINSIVVIFFLTG